MIRYRTFRNTDPPALAELWRAAAPTPGFMQPMSVEWFERLIFSKPYFDNEGLVVALDEPKKVVGFAHAGFGASDDHKTLSTSFGVTCVLLVHPEYRQQGIGAELLTLCEDYLRHHGAEVLYAGPIAPLNPFYLGLYGGSELPGVLESLPEAHEFLVARGYGEADRTIVLERDLTSFRPPVDRKHHQIRRRTMVEVTSDPSARDWWDACTYGNFDRIRYDLRSRESNQRIARATVWMLDPLSRSWGVRAVGLVDVEVDEAERRKGYATFLLAEAFRRLHEQGIALVQVQTMERNTAALDLYRKLGFEQTDTGLVYRRQSS